jgi:hypothetical protein
MTGAKGRSGGSRPNAGRKPSQQRLEEVRKGIFKGVAYVGGGKERGLSPGEYTRASQWDEYDKLFLTRPEVSSAILTIAGQVISRGYTTAPNIRLTLDEGAGTKETTTKPTAPADDPTALKAKELCDAYAADINADSMIHASTIFLCLHGTLFLENNVVGKKMINTRMFPWQKQMEPASISSDGYMIAWRQMKMGSKVKDFKENEIVALRFPPVDEQGYGTSLITSVKSVLATRTQLDADMKDYIHKTAWPKEMFSLGDQSTPATPENAEATYGRVKNWKPGDVYVTNVPVKYQACGVGDAESRIFPQIMTVMNDRCVDGLLVAPISYRRNATEASARVLDDNMRVSLIQPIQQLWKRALEREIFTPLLEGEGVDPKYCPSIMFTPPTEDELLKKTQRIIAIAQGLNARSWALKQLDIKEEEAPVEQPKPEKPPDAKPESPESKAPASKGEEKRGGEA